VTYADVWEFWRKHPEVADAVDFVTIHTLPYWEDEPVGIDRAIPHVAQIWRGMRDEFRGKPVFIGEAGWPSAGRMRGPALPSQVNQARFVRELMTVAEREGIGINLIESFDQPWKRRLEGTVGGHWGLFGEDRVAKFPLSGPVSDDHDWPRHFVLTAALGLILLIPTLVGNRRLSAVSCLGLAAGAVAAASLLVVGFREGTLGSRTAYDWTVFAVRWLTAASAAALVLWTLPRCRAGRTVRPLPMAELAEAVRRQRPPARSGPETALGVLRAVALFGATATTLCLVFDPRYRDFSNALHALPAFAFVALAIACWPERVRGDLAEERLLAVILAAGGLIVAVREGFANHQALIWTALALMFATAIYLEAFAGRAALDARAMARAPSSTPPAAGSGT
jgi:glucan 1,3-beta-glucosidase